MAKWKETKSYKMNFTKKGGKGQESSTAGAGSKELAEKYRGYYRKVGNYRQTYRDPDELKFIDTTSDNDIPSTGEIGHQCNLIAQGTGESQRIGIKCKVHSIGMRGFVYNGNTIWDTGIVRAVLIMDTEANGTAATWTDIFRTTDVNSFVNLKNPTRFKIIKQWWFDIQSGNAVYNTTASTTDHPGQEFHFDYYRKFDEPVPLHFSSTTGAITEIKSNNFFVCYNSTKNNKFGIVVNTRVRFSG